MSLPSRLATQLQTKLHTVRALTSAGVIRAQRPDRLARTAAAFLRWGPTPAAGYAANAARYPDETAIIDELGTLTFKEVHERTNALAHALREDGIGEGDGVAIMCRNHRGFVEAYVAVSKLGANALFMNTDLIKDAGTRRKRYIAWHDPEDGETRDPRLEDLIEGGDTTDLSPPNDRGKAVILTSGTTGTPKGASRSQPKSLDPAAALLAMIPLKAREKTMIAAPMFHSAWRCRRRSCSSASSIPRGRCRSPLSTTRPRWWSCR
jgi:acyl-CoA synthetase (AMP-forming)/AMP-acid ligase II